MLKSKTKVEPYDVYIGIHDGYLFLEVFPFNNLNGNSLKIPMETLYKYEIEYVLGDKNWKSKKLEGFTDKVSISDFTKPDMPKLLAWWTHFLPRPKKVRRRK